MIEVFDVLVVVVLWGHACVKIHQIAHIFKMTKEELREGLGS
jgi:hypothetical protein